MPTPKPDRTLRTAKKASHWKRFVLELAKSGNVSDACKKARVSRSRAHQRRKDNPGFAEMWSDALEIAADRLESEADRRASRGVKKLLLFKGAPVIVSTEEGKHLPGFVETQDEHGQPSGRGYLFETVYSDTLLIFLLKGIRPDKFADRRKVDAHHSGDIGVAVSKTLAEEIAAARAARTIPAAATAAALAVDDTATATGDE